MGSELDGAGLRIKAPRKRSRTLPARRPDARYVRLEHPTERVGVFSYVDDARKALDNERRAELQALMWWFNEHLDAPSRMVPFRAVGKCARTVVGGPRPARSAGSERRPWRT